MPTVAKQNNNGIQALRALACLAVLMQHAIYFSFDVKGNPLWQYLLRIGPGDIGVHIFFVISGYVITNSMRHGRKFILHRLLRIYPPFWGAILLSSLLLLLGREWYVDKMSLLLIPGFPLNNSYSVPYWTLIYEILFYAVMYVCILLNFNRERTLYFFFSWILLIILFDIYKHTTINIHMPGIFFFFSPINILFFFGVLLAVKQEILGERTPSIVLVLTAVIAWNIARQFASAPVLYFSFLGISYGVLIIYFKRLSVTRVISKIGNASYGIYLIHTIVILLFIGTITRFNLDIPLMVLTPLTILIAFTFSYFYGLIEYKTYQYLSRRYLE